MEFAEIVTCYQSPTTKQESAGRKTEEKAVRKANPYEAKLGRGGHLKGKFESLDSFDAETSQHKQYREKLRGLSLGICHIGMGRGKRMAKKYHVLRLKNNHPSTMDKQNLNFK